MRNIEKRVLSKIIDAQQMREALKLGVLEEFFVGQEQLIFQFLLEYWMKYRAVPDVTKVQQLFPDFITEPTQEPIRALVDELKEYYTYHSISRIVKQGVDMLQKDTQGALSFLGTEINHIKTGMDGYSSVLWSGTPERLDRVKQYKRLKKLGIQGIPSYFAKLNECIGKGFRDEQLIFVVGRPTSGKTWWLSVNAIHAWRKGFKVLFFTREMSNYEIGRRLDAIRFKLPYSEFVTAKLPKAMEDDYMDQMSQDEDLMDLVVTSEGHTTYSVQQKIMEVQPDIVFIDGVYLMEIKSGESKTEAIYRTTGELKQLAKQFKVPIVGSTQMARGTHGGKGGNDRLAKIAWGDAFGQDSDICVELIYDGMKAKTKTMWHLLAKNREGPSGVSFASFWDFDKMDFRCYAEHETPDMTMDQQMDAISQEESEQAAIKVLGMTK